MCVCLLIKFMTIGNVAANGVPKVVGGAMLTIVLLVLAYTVRGYFRLLLATD